MRAFKLPLKSIPFLMMLLCSLPQCVGTEVGNPQDDSSVSVVGYDRTYTQALSSDSPLTLSHAWLSLSLIELKPCDGGKYLEVKGEHAMNLLTGQGYPNSARLPHSEISYCKMKLRWEPLTQELFFLPAGMKGISLFLDGTRADGTPFSVRAKLKETYTLNAKKTGGFRFEEGIHPMLGIEFQTMLSRALQEAQPDGQGRILIDEQTNKSALAEVQKGFMKSINFFDDADNDRRVDPAIDELVASSLSFRELIEESDVTGPACSGDDGDGDCDD